MKSEADVFTTAELADDASSSPKNRSRRCPKGPRKIAQGCESLRATLGKLKSVIFWPLRQGLSGRDSLADKNPGCAHKASRPWAILGNPFWVKNNHRQHKGCCRSSCIRQNADEGASTFWRMRRRDPTFGSRELAYSRIKL